MRQRLLVQVDFPSELETCRATVSAMILRLKERILAMKDVKLLVSLSFNYVLTIACLTY